VWSQSQKWLGRCPECEAWNSLVEERAVPTTPGAGAAAAARARGATGRRRRARLCEEIDTVVSARLTTGIDEFDRVLGGGSCRSLVLIGGEPGIEEVDAAAPGGGALRERRARSSTAPAKSPSTRSSRAASASRSSGRRCICWRRRASTHPREIARLRPALIIVDSVQTVFSPLKFQSAPGSIGQVREAATQLLFAAKGQNIPTFLVGHVTKDGSLAGPKVLEHIVDTVLYFEGEKHHSHRVVRAVKNRFGAVSELGVFEMTGKGLKGVPNPSALFLAERPANVAGSAVLCCMEGSRPLLVEVQALVSTSSYGNAKRMASGIDQNRLSLLLAVLEKRAGLNLMGEDVFVNVAGGMTVDEPAADLAVVAAVASSLRNRPIRPGTAVFGEVGLAGEVRSAPQAALRLREAGQMGFTRCIIPEGNCAPDEAPPGCELCVNVGEALDQLMEW
jgi:DNA repair protein RadA/Sms